MDDEEFLADSEDDFEEETLDEEADASDLDEKLEILPDDMPALHEGDDTTFTIDANETKLKMLTQPKTTVDFLTRFEKPRILGLRIKQLILGAKPLVDTSGLQTEKEIALKELQEKRLPLIVRRYISRNPDKFEDWHLKDLRLEA